jgi:hypothetical protein
MTLTPNDSLQSASGESQKYQLLHEGFVDEALVRQMVMGTALESQHTNHEPMALASSEDDYAGWDLPANASLGRAA